MWVELQHGFLLGCLAILRYSSFLFMIESATSKHLTRDTWNLYSSWFEKCINSRLHFCSSAPNSRNGGFSLQSESQSPRYPFQQWKPVAAPAQRPVAQAAWVGWSLVSPAAHQALTNGSVEVSDCKVQARDDESCDGKPVSRLNTVDPSRTRTEIGGAAPNYVMLPRKNGICVAIFLRV